MRDISILLEQLQLQLEQRIAVTNTSNKPDKPLALFYVGKKSLEAQKDIERTLRKVWRAQADAVCHFLIEGKDLWLCREGEVVRPLESQDVITLCEQMQDVGSCFHSPASLLLCLVQNTSQYSSVEEFKSGFQVLNDLMAIFTDKYCQTMKIVLLDESATLYDLPAQIKHYLHKALDDPDPLCTRTVLLSNRLSGGHMLLGQSIRMNYELAGNVLVLVNGRSDNFSPVYSTIFPINSKELVTAAHSRITRPNREICEVMVNSLLEWLQEDLDNGGHITTAQITDRLGIRGGVMTAITDSYKRSMAHSIPSRETLECLPRSTMNLDPLGGMPFDQFDNLTLGSFDAFFRENVISSDRIRSFAEQFRDEFRITVRSVFSPKEASVSLTPQVIDAVLREISVEAPARTRPAYDYMCRLAQMHHCKAMIPVCREVLLELCKESSAYISQLRSLVDEFNHKYMNVVDPTVISCYAPLVRQSLDGEIGAQFTIQITRRHLTYEALLDAIYDALTLVISDHPIFSMTLPEELTRRLGGSNSAMQTAIRQALTEKLGDTIRLRSPVSPKNCLDIIMLDSKCDTFDFLQEIYPGMIAMNTGNSSALEMVQFYQAGSTII